MCMQSFLYCFLGPLCQRFPCRGIYGSQSLPIRGVDNGNSVHIVLLLIHLFFFSLMEISPGACMVDTVSQSSYKNLGSRGTLMDR